MRQSPVRKARSRRLSAFFNQLCDTDQRYMDTLTAQLAEIQTAAPETLLSTGKTPKSIVEQKEEQD